MCLRQNIVLVANVAKTRLHVWSETESKLPKREWRKHGANMINDDIYNTVVGSCLWIRFMLETFVITSLVELDMTIVKLHLIKDKLFTRVCSNNNNNNQSYCHECCKWIGAINWLWIHHSLLIIALCFGHHPCAMPRRHGTFSIWCVKRNRISMVPLIQENFKQPPVVITQSNKLRMESAFETWL